MFDLCCVVLPLEKKWFVIQAAMTSIWIVYISFCASSCIMDISSFRLISWGVAKHVREFPNLQFIMGGRGGGVRGWEGILEGMMRQGLWGSSGVGDGWDKCVLWSLWQERGVWFYEQPWFRHQQKASAEWTYARAECKSHLNVPATAPACDISAPSWHTECHQQAMVKGALLLPWFNLIDSSNF